MNKGQINLLGLRELQACVPLGKDMGFLGMAPSSASPQRGPLSYRGLLCKMVLLLCSQAAVAAGRYKDGRGWGLHAWSGCPRVLLDNVCILDLLSSPPAHKPSCTLKGGRHLLPKRDFFCIAVPALPCPHPFPNQRSGPESVVWGLSLLLLARRPLPVGASAILVRGAS